MGCLPTSENLKYLNFLSSYCKKNRIILIFDEIISGFRTDMWSVQNKKKIKPNITLLGKVLGGGLPIGLIGLDKHTSTIFKKLKKKVFFGGTFSANILTCFVSLRILQFLKKNKNLINQLIKNCSMIENKINNFTKNNKIDVKLYRYDTIMRIIFSKKNIQNRLQRDFLEKTKIKKQKLFFNYLRKEKIFYPTNGVILPPTTFSKQDAEYFIKIVCKGLLKYFK